MPLKNLILACLESSPSRIAGKKVCSLFLFLSQVIGIQKYYLVQNFEKKPFTPFSAAYYFLIDFPKILQFTFPCNQPFLLNILRYWEHWTEYNFKFRIDGQEIP